MYIHPRKPIRAQPIRAQGRHKGPAHMGPGTDLGLRRPNATTADNMWHHRKSILVWCRL